MESFWNWAPTLIQGGLTLWGASQQADAVNNAAVMSANAQNSATQAQLQGLEDARQIAVQQQAAASPGLTAMQNMITRGPGLNPAQQTALDDSRRTTIDSLHGSGLRGSGRATVAAVRKVEGDMRDQYLNQNQNRADNAAGALSSQYFNAGNNLASNATSQGNAISQGLTSVGDINASGALGQSGISGKAIGDIGAIIADEIKSQRRESTYKDVTRGV